MAITGAFVTRAATQQPMAAKPPPVARHGQKTQPDDAWSPPADTTGGGAPWAQADPVLMQARGIRLDLGHQYGHQGTTRTAWSRRPFVASRKSGRSIGAAWEQQGAAEDAAARAHGDSTTGYYAGHQYAPQPQLFAGEAYGVLPNNVGSIPSTSTQQAIHDTPGGQHSAGSGGDYAPTGFPLGIGREDMPRWAVARYSSPTLGAMYSKNSLRGILPQVVATPYNQPALTTGPWNSGIPSNARWLSPRFTMPQLFRSPPSESEGLMAAQGPAADGGATMGVGF
jgi:hypothetical protein